MKIDFTFSCGESVKLRAIDRPALVTGLLSDTEGKQYRCVWWEQGQRYNAWLFEYEIAKEPAK